MRHRGLKPSATKKRDPLKGSLKVLLCVHTETPPKKVKPLIHVRITPC